jgi:hypothetical protein
MAQKSLELLTNSGRFRPQMDADRGRSTIRAILGVAVATAIAVAGCGGGDEKPKGAGPSWPPSSRRG